LFSDIRGFTAFSEKALPYDAIHILNRYFNRMGAAVLENDGYIDKYIGDGLMALFGLKEEDPDMICLKAIKAALSMIEELNDLNRYLKDHFDLEFKIGIGIHFGNAILGEIGHPGKRQFTAIGDSVNLASRIESTTKKANAEFLVSSDVYSILKTCINIGRVFETKLKGKTGVYRLYEILSVKEHRLSPIEALQSSLYKFMTLEDAPKFLRLVFHDVSNFNVETKTGGANASIRFELEREENQDLRTVFTKVEIIKKDLEEKGFNISYADIIAIGGAVAVYKTGGPRIQMSLGRIDATEAGNQIHITTPDIDIKELLYRFSLLGLEPKELVVLSGAHTIGKANGKPMTDDLFRFTNSYFKKLLEFCHGARNENLAILNSDIVLLDMQETRKWVELYARNEIQFFEDFSKAYQKITSFGKMGV
ncbi:MAG TPA: adenylate/guanylate cyclase domain-containing protein, partial [Leptospiraceae bacterium]|nr:adenylate/guanylate cyclase domain-containing protein [Leptospiraceae bacterium]